MLGPADAPSRARGGCCATPARSPSPPRRSTPVPPRCGALGRPPRGAGRRRRAARRPTRVLSGPAPSGGARDATTVVVGRVPARHRADVFGGSAHGPAVRLDALCATRASGSWSSSAGGRPKGRAADRRPVRRGSRRRRPGHPGPVPRAQLGPGGAVGPPRRRRLAAGAPTGPQRRAAARARARRGRPRAAHPGRRRLPPALGARGTLIETLSAYLHNGGSIEATARTLFVHPNTVRYRLKQAAEVTGLAPTAARRLHRPDRPDPRPAVRTRVTTSTTLCRDPTKNAVSFRGRRPGAAGSTRQC